MIAQILLTLFIGAAWLYVATQPRISRLIKYPLYVALASGLYFVWFPDVATKIANSVGIGRGADLLFYTWIIFSIGVLINLHMKIRQHLNLITELSRHIAISNPCVKSQSSDSALNKVSLDEKFNPQ